jgi:hypothetical protein
MTLAPRLEVYTQLACNSLYGHHELEWNHTRQSTYNSSSDIANIPLYASIDPLGPHFHPYSLFPKPGTTFVPNLNDQSVDDTEDPRRIPSAHCVSDPAVQASAARLQTIMTTTMGMLSALTIGWWGHFSERHGKDEGPLTLNLGLIPHVGFLPLRSTSPLPLILPPFHFQRSNVYPRFYSLFSTFKTWS